MANLEIEEFKEMILRCMTSSGATDRIKANIQAELSNVMKVEHTLSVHKNEDDLIIESLISEYLNFKGYRYTEKVFNNEVGSDSNSLPRNSLTSMLNLRVLLKKDTNQPQENTQKMLPLLYYITESLRNQ
ncbi:hypothetical protein Ciccas_001942 [Cichlidogyrus casuarinus]|uniref:MINDY4 N-terminal dimerisation domain-containing protein n=1 Tax=Cichlidogyrus casuarinus TaxID=1844966 RepID=A0ABD2QJ71_9PLAT